MKKKYSISNGFADIKIQGTAGSKAPADMSIILKNNGYEPLFLEIGQDESAFRRIVGKFMRLIEISKIVGGGGGVLIFQYPLYQFLFLTMFFFRKHKKQLLIHDLDSIRYGGKISWLERQNLKYFDEIICHTEEMKKVLQTVVNVRILTLNCFDYLLDYKDQTSKRKNEKNITFAGNIDKSEFLEKFIEQNQNLKINLYGKMTRKFQGNFEYKGQFHPNEIGFIEGSYGLVWDGESTETCAGTIGDYLRIIASHKISLYIVASLPLIVWEESAMARFVRENNIGFTIKSLSEIALKIENVSENQYSQYLENLRKLAPKIASGGMLQDVIKQLNL